MAHPAHDRGNARARIRHRPHRSRSPAARSQSHQALPAALQHPAPRRQVVSLDPDRPRPSVSPGAQAPRRARAQRRLLRSLRLGLGGQRGALDPATRLPFALLSRFGVRQPRPALPAPSDQALLGAVRRAGDGKGLRPPGRGRAGFPRRPQPGNPGRALGPNAGGERPRRVRAGGRTARSSPRARPGPVQGARPSRERDRGRRDRRAPGGRANVHRGFLLPRRRQLGRPRVFSLAWKRGRDAGGARSVPRPVLRRPSPAKTCSPQPPVAPPRAGGRGAQDSRRPQGRGRNADPGRKARDRRARARQRARRARPPARRERLAAEAPRCARGDARARLGPFADRGLRQQPHPGRRRRRRHDRGRTGRIHEGGLSQVHDQVRKPHSRRRLRHDARGSGAPVLPRPQGRSRPRLWPMARSGAARRRRRTAFGRGPGAGRSGLGRHRVGRHRQRTRARRRARAHLYPRPRAVPARGARSGSLFSRAAARRGAPLRHRRASRQAREGHGALGVGRNSRHRQPAQAGALAPFRRGRGGFPGGPGGTGTGAGRQPRDRPQNL